MGVDDLGSIRRPRGGRRALTAAVVVAVLGVLAVVGWRHADHGDGSSQVTPASYVRVPVPGDDFARLPSRCAQPDEPMPFRPCSITRFPGRPTVVVYGDSYGLMYLPGLRREAESHRDNLVMVVAGGCPPAVPAGGPATPRPSCESHDIAANAYLRRLAVAHTHHGAVTGLRVVLGSFWDGYTTGLAHTPATTDAARAYQERIASLAVDGTDPLFRQLGRLGVPTDVIAEAAIVPTSPPDCAAGRTPYRCDVPRSEAFPDADATRTRLLRMMHSLPAGSRYVDPSRMYCDADVCHGVVDGADTWFDDVHLGARLASRMSGYFAPTFASLG